MRRSPLRSPPRVRGKDTIITELANVLRITPACAGKSRCAWLAACHRRDHPRVCGEKHQQPKAATAGIGSPPRVRGKVQYRTSRSLSRRITPACAGKSAMLYFLPLLLRDHPRVCGEKVPKYLFIGAGCRITPACAGKRVCRYHGLSGKQDHPRVCGEKTGLILSLLGVTGSPPRVRGKD